MQTSAVQTLSIYQRFKILFAVMLCLAIDIRSFAPSKARLPASDNDVYVYFSVEMSHILHCVK